jgi:hypothetical protein
MVTSKSGTAQTNIEQVEIFNGDQLLGSVPSVAGKWTYSPSGLSVGEYSLTACCRGVESATWRFRVDEPGVIDDFEDLTHMYYGDSPVTRPYFTAQFRRVTGNGIVNFKSEFSYILDPPDMCLLIGAYRWPDYSADIAGRFFFNSVYAAISLKCEVYKSSATGVVGTVQAFDERGTEVDRKDLVELEVGAIVDLKFGGTDRSPIKYLEFHMDSGVIQGEVSEFTIKVLSVAMS